MSHRSSAVPGEVCVDIVFHRSLTLLTLRSPARARHGGPRSYLLLRRDPEHSRPAWPARPACDLGRVSLPWPAGVAAFVALDRPRPVRFIVCSVIRSSEIENHRDRRRSPASTPRCDAPPENHPSRLRKSPSAVQIPIYSLTRCVMVI